MAAEFQKKGSKSQDWGFHPTVILEALPVGISEIEFSFFLSEKILRFQQNVTIWENGVRVNRRRKKKNVFVFFFKGGRTSEVDGNSFKL